MIEGIDYCLGNVEIAERILPDSEEQIVGDYGYEGAKLLLLGFKGQTQIAMYQPSKWDELITCFVNVANAILEEDYKKAKEIMSTVNSDSAREINRVLSGIGLT